MKILNLTEKEGTPIQVRTGLYEPNLEDKKAIKDILELKEKMFLLLGTRGGNEQYSQEGLEVFTVLAKKLATIAKKYGTPCMIGIDPFLGRFEPYPDRSQWLRITFLERTFLDALANALKEIGLTPMYSQTCHGIEDIRTRVVKEDEKEFMNRLDDEVIDSWEYTQGANEKGIKRVNQVRIEAREVTETIKWYAVT